MENYEKVDLLNEFNDIEHIEKLVSIFNKNGWNLLKKVDSETEYQLYFGEGIQVDNMYEYAFPYLLDRDLTKKELQRILKYELNLERTLSAYYGYKTMPEWHKDNIKFYYIYDGIFNAFPDIDEEDAKFIFSICEKIENENINPYSISHYLTDHYTNGTLSKEQIKQASSGEICEAVYYDNLSYIKSIDEVEIEKD